MATADIDQVSENNDLHTEEKETTIRFAKDEDEVTIHTDEGGLMRRLIAHDEVEIIDAHRGDEDTVASVRATFPVGMLSISSSPRASGSHAEVVTSAALQ